MDMDDNNPFAEPVRQSAAGQSLSTQPATSDYNPFSSAAPSSPPPPPVSPSAVYVPPPASAPIFQAPVYTPTSPSAYSAPSPTVYTPSSPPPVITSAPYYSSDQREASTRVDVTPLERQQAELAEREKRLNDKTTPISPSAPMIIRKKNFPPLPKFCPIGPCFYHDIKLDIPGPLQSLARFLYILWIGHAVTLLLNMICGLSYFVVDSSGGSTFGMSLVYFILFVPLSYICWYRPIYRALRTDSSVYYMLFFFISVLFVATNVLFATGLIAGMCGLILMLKIFSHEEDGIIVGLVAMIITFSFALLTLAAIYLLIEVHRIYRASGASIEQAQRELQTAITTNPTVRGAARDAARDAAVVGINEAMSTGGK